MLASVTIRTTDKDGHQNVLTWSGKISSIWDACSEADNMMSFMHGDTIDNVDIQIDYGD